jgi:multidrug efflux pump subunit AcrB
VNPSAPFIRRPVATSLIAAAVLVLGIVAYFNLPVAALPNVDFPTIQVSANLPGASPETMASNVATPLERQFSSIPGLVQLTSVSSTGSTNVTLQFELSRKLDAAAQDVLAAISAAAGQLPTNLPSQPQIRKVNPADADHDHRAHVRHPAAGDGG